MTVVASSRLAELITTLPGFDPYENAEGCRFDEAKAHHVIEFFEYALVHVKGDLAGQKFILEDWQKALLANLFGWQREDGMGRRFREAFIFIPRKNGKSILASGICLYMFFCDGEQGAEIVCAASEQKQARLVWNVAKKMIEKDPAMSKVAKLFQHSIMIEESFSTFMPISSESSSAHGMNLHCAVMDELHVQKTDDLVVALQTSMGSRRQPLMVHITTSDFERVSVCNKKHDYASKVRDGIIQDQSFLPVIFEASKDDDWTDPEVWKRANPNYGISVRADYIAHECQRAKDDPTYENEFKRLQLNIRTEQSVRYIKMEDWDLCNGEVNEKDLLGRPCYGGLDLSTVEDLSALVLVFPNADNTFDVLPYFWGPKDNAINREKRHRVPYLTWAKQGHIRLTPGNRIDYNQIELDIKELSKKFKIVDIGYDIYNAEQIQENLHSQYGLTMVEFRQGFLSMNEPMKKMLWLLKGADLNHGGHPVLRWNASNVCAQIDPAGNVKPDKKKSAEKIDGIVALIMAIGRATLGDKPKESVYKTRGFRYLG